jgi:DNA polymerase alpha subunit A
LYHEVSEAQYKRIVKGRLQEDDFVIDDGVGGYMDNGVDDWGEADDYASDDVEEESPGKRSMSPSMQLHPLRC